MLDTFAEFLKQRLSSGLPGEAAHLRMAPAGRTATSEYLSKLKVKPRPSAVLILFFPGEREIHTVLIKRPPYEGVHSGQIAFPGGKSEEQDLTIDDTALREAREETGIDPAEVTVLGHLSTLYIPPSNFLVTPVLGFTSRQPDWLPDPREVESIITPPLPHLLDDSIIGEEDFKGSSGTWSIRAPYFRVDGHAVWGATAMIISELKDVVAAYYR